MLCASKRVPCWAGLSLGFRFGGWEIGPNSDLALLHTVRFLKVFFFVCLFLFLKVFKN